MTAASLDVLWRGEWELLRRCGRWLVLRPRQVYDLLTPTFVVGKRTLRSARHSAQFSSELRHAENKLGLSESLLQAHEDAELPRLEDRWSRRDVEAAPPTAHIDDLIEPALDRLLEFVDRRWLKDEAGSPIALSLLRDFFTLSVVQDWCHRGLLNDLNDLPACCSWLRSSRKA
jgi:hypothetical protein